MFSPSQDSNPDHSAQQNNAKCAILHVKFVSSEVESGPAGFHDALKIHVSAFPALSRDA
jgi:hypothetical protein